MTKLQFSKTRVVYWDSAANGLVLPANANTIPNGVGPVPTTVEKDALPYLSYGILGSTHNWHMIPQNQYGLYCTSAEINALYENSSSFTPTHMGFTVSHTIPLSKTASGSTTQLSFNNTIYSLVYDLPSNYLVQPGLCFSTIQEANVFFRTFDGLKYSDSTRNLLPKPDILFKVPNAKTQGSTYMTRVGTNATSAPAAKEYAKYPNFNSVRTGMPDGHTQNSLVNAYLPEFLQDNKNVKALYPGENQDDMQHDLQSFATWSTIHTSCINFNEVFASLDCRNFGVNFLNVAFPSDIMLFMNVIPECAGVNQPWTQVTGNVIKTPYTAMNNTGTSTVAKDFGAAFWSTTMQQKAQALHNDFITNILPKKWIKCLPIVANDNIVVDHTICATITWTLDVDITDRIHKEINPWKWEMVWPTRIAERKYDNTGALTSTIVKEYMRSGWPVRPLNDSHCTSLRLRCRDLDDLQPDNITTTYNQDKNYVPPVMKHAANVDEHVPTENLENLTRFTNTIWNQNYTAAWPNSNEVNPTANVTHKKVHAHSLSKPSSSEEPPEEKDMEEDYVIL